MLGTAKVVVNAPGGDSNENTISFGSHVGSLENTASKALTGPVKRVSRVVAEIKKAEARIYSTMGMGCFEFVIEVQMLLGNLCRKT